MLTTLLPALRDLELPLRLRLWDGKEIDMGPAPSVTLEIRDPGLIPRLAHPSLALLGGAYVEGKLDLHGPLEEVIRIGDEISRALDDAHPQLPVREAHDKATDAEAISYHYDLSNAFYQLWLDRDMVYSCGYFETGCEDLDQAQQAKLRHLCRKLRLQPGDRLLDVGCGWGGLARFAAREYGAQVFGITLSAEQLRLGRERVAAEGLEGRVQLELLDYRDLPTDGQFDKVVSVGMFEHVGHANLPLYCQQLAAVVRPGGLVLNHGITSRHTDGRPVAHGAGEFIDRYVFPHGELPHLVEIGACISESGLEIVDVESLRLHYARTLQLWSERLESRLEEAQQLIPERALRIWRVYLAGCAYGFRRNWINLHQILASKPLPDGSHELPWTRADLYQ
ncbi:MAG: class I SAM-dependent methyltransferase [Gammaproteobacteria bacterium]|uniref:C17 cyclopropane fatty acid synthase CfaB n=1 Tax=Stutzerimonas xanthomarina TaxID=271420 RepID=UPI000E958F62|nr:C17 cyclopropane fatty acid synthase CfaB [Stutzerimonas xanthomarina]MBU0811022.1 class I SAM-dependent methyltransferase [Gammaproteobacteria bacterium]HAW23571.1 SAM-dependent methyltransferase [Pseudomonas sp.]MBK3849826.1 methyltransferase domain-containing protein [Stutzerimonas xanthomarina]MBU0853502.1 class I SAM-dependent methyltransferase [Gammaproteobacteria bacterium]MBU1303591.1 class I SAM-dependent methyltransferase [Gammaproteobacteria bacterium]